MTPIETCLADRRPPLPWLDEVAADLEGEPVDAFRTDAGARARSLATAADLFDLPAVSTTFDPTPVAEAAGCEVEHLDGAGDPRVEGFVRTVDDALDVDVAAVTERGRVPAVLDATDRLVAALDRTSVLGGLTGPAWLTGALLAGDAAAADEIDDPATAGAVDDPAATEAVDAAVVEEAAFVAEDLMVALTNAYLDRGADGVVVLEPAGLGDPDRFRESAVPLLNVVDHFDATAVLAARSLDTTDVELAGSVGFDAVTGGVAAPAAALSVADEAGLVLGVGVPSEALLEGPEAVAAIVDDLPADALLSSEWAVPRGTAPEAVHELVASS